MTTTTPSSHDNGAVHPTEVKPKAARRRFTAEYKRKIVAEADACTKMGELGALLRREGLYSSHLSKWRESGPAVSCKALRRSSEDRSQSRRIR